MTFTLTAVVKSNGREIQFRTLRTLFSVREVLISRTVAHTKILLEKNITGVFNFYLESC
jgi:hypothetical protein